MAKINILFDSTEYAIDEANLAPATGALKAHLETLGSGGGLKYDEEVQFKEIITSADLIEYLKAIESYKDVYAPQGVVMYKDESLQLHMISCIENPTARIYLSIQCFMTADMFVENGTDFSFVYENMGNIGAAIGWTMGDESYGYILNNETIKLFEGKVAGLDPYMSLTDGWHKADISDPLNPTFITTDAPTVTFEKDVITIEPDISVYSSFFDLGGDEGNLDITLDGAIYKVDSTKLAPATNNLIAHIETLKGGDEGGSGLEFDTPYVFKKDLNNIDCSVFMVEENLLKPDIPEEEVQQNPDLYAKVKFYKIADMWEYYLEDRDWNSGVREPPATTTTPYYTILTYWDAECVEAFLTLNGASSELREDFIGSLRFMHLDESGFPLQGIEGLWYPNGETYSLYSNPTDGTMRWINGHEEVFTKITAIIPSTDANKNISLDELAVFFDIPSAGGSGTLEFGKEYTFKKNITVDDFEYYIENATQLDGPSDVDLFSITIIANEDGMSGAMGTRVYYTQYPDRPPVYEIQVVANSMPQFSFRLNSINPELPDGWCKIEINEEDGTEIYTPIDTPPTVTILEDATMYADLATTAVFFDLGGGSGNEGDTKIVINGVEYLVDSTKLADAKSALAAHLQALEGEENLITFTIGGTSYQAEEGMTWYEWCNSEYNTDGYYTRDLWVNKNSNWFVAQVSASDVIESQAYILEEYGTNTGGTND